jgi:hypothetical protein
MKRVLSIVIISIIQLSGYSQTCNCPDFEFSSSKNLPIIKIRSGQSQLIVCGYSNVDLDCGYISGVLQKDSSIYLSGFNVFSCTDKPTSIIYFGELNAYKLRPYKNYLTIDLITNLPVGKDLSYKYASLIRFQISKQQDKWIISKPQVVLDYSALSDNDFFKIKKDLGWDKLYPELIFPRDEAYEENKIMYAFIVALKNYPKYNQNFVNLGNFDGYLAELHDELKQILIDIE